MKIILAKYKDEIVVIIFGLAFFAAIYFMFVPIISKLRGTSDEIQKKIIDQQIEEARLGNLTQMKDELAKYEKQKSSVAVILEAGSEASFIESLESMAASTGNSVSLKISEASKEASGKASGSDKKKAANILTELTYKKYFPIEVNLKGNYQSFINFLHKLENSQYYANVISLNIKKSARDNQSAASSGASEIFSSSPSSSSDNSFNESEKLDTSINIIVYTK